MEYGYLRGSSKKTGELQTGELRSMDELTSAIRSLQRHGHIPVTGVVDERTRDLMRRPRCSMPDMLRTNDERARSGAPQNFKVASTKWQKNDLTYRLVAL